MPNGLEDISFWRDGNCGSIEAYGTSVRDCTFRGERGGSAIWQTAICFVADLLLFWDSQAKIRLEGKNWASIAEWVKDLNQRNPQILQSNKTRFDFSIWYYWADIETNDFFSSSFLQTDSALVIKNCLYGGNSTHRTNARWCGGKVQ